MDCNWVISKMGEYIDGELGEHDVIDIRSHLQKCGNCSELVTAQKTIDQSLRTAVLTAPINSADLRIRVRNALPTRKSFLGLVSWKFASAAIVTVALVIFGLAAYRHYHPAVGPSDALYADLVDDYLDHGRPAPADIVQPDENRMKRIMARYEGVEKVMESMQQQNYTLIERRLCSLDKTTFLHLIYTKDGKYLSVFFKRVDNPVLKDTPTETIANISLHECIERGQAVAALQGPHSVLLLIGEFPGRELRNLANSTAPSLSAA
ncbi:MAG TPA: zf-HC2 domain-containing protein [Blastocatellia bacterium]|nr:zf-HC2 domain-containing protein [Blastocatellia bacterium]